MSDPITRLNAALDGRYRVERRVGEGGMAVVYRAHDVKHDRSVALKVMKAELRGSDRTDRFMREIGVAARLSHPHVLPLYDSGEVDAVPFIVMPFLEEETLRDRIEREGALPLPDAVRLAGEIASALSYAHEQGLVHRDIKPANILLQSGHATVADFGIARVVGEEGRTRFTQTGMVLGTVAYMSPEQASGDAEVDGRTDVYALGCVVFEMIEGVRVFDGRTPQAVLAKKVTGVLPEFAHDTQAPPTIQAVVLKALSVDPDDRYSTPTAFFHDLERAITTQAIEAAAASRRGRRRLRIAGATVAIAVAIGAGAWLTLALSAPVTSRIAVLPFENARSDPDQELLLAGMHGALITEMQEAGLQVVGRRSVMQYRNDDTPISEIAEALQVDAVLETSAFYTADSVGLRLSLTDGATQTGVWNDVFAAPASGVLRLYRDVTNGLAQAIDFELSAEVAARLASAPPVDPQAYEAYITGRGHWNRLAPEDLDLARAYFQRALDIQPDYALAHVGMAQLYAGLQQMGLMPPGEANPLIRASVEQALAADSTIAEAHFAEAGFRVWSEWDWDGGETSFRRALAINPQYADAHAYYAHLLVHLGRIDEAVAEAELALELEPVSPLIGSLRCVVLGLAERHEEALAACDDVLARDPRQIVALDGRTISLASLERWEDVVKNDVVRANQLGAIWRAEVTQRAYEAKGFEAGMAEVADSMIARVAREEFVSPTDVALTAWMAGRVEQALDWLELALELHAPGLPYMRSGWWPEEVRDHPRFEAIWLAMRLPDPG